MATEDLTPWLNRVKQAASRKEIYGILDEFRKVEWTDEQAAQMSKLYMRILQRVGNTGEDQDEVVKPAAAQTEESGPVWYEKM